MTEATPHTDKAEARNSRRRKEGALALRVLLVVVLFLLAWAGAVVLWGIPGLYLPALALVPVIWVLLLMVSFG